MEVLFAESVDDFGSWGYVVFEELCFDVGVNWVWLKWWS